MKRAREDRGKDKWERITWDEAFDHHCREACAYYKENYGAESILHHGRHRPRQRGPMLPAYAQACIGTPNACYTQSGYSCYIPRVAGTTYVLGATYPEMDYAAACRGATTTRCSSCPSSSCSGPRSPCRPTATACSAMPPST